MKKTLWLTMALLFAVTALTVSCGKGVSESKPEGWIDEDTFRVSVIGYAPEDSDRKWKAEARTAAEIVAAETIMRKMVGSYIESTGATENNELIGRVVREKAAGAIIGYQIIDVKYDDSDKSATIVAEMKSDGLRKLMNRRIEQYFKELSESAVGPQSMGE